MGGRPISRPYVIGWVLIIFLSIPGVSYGGGGSWSQTTLDSGILPLENRAAMLGPKGSGPDLLVFTLWSTGTNMNHLGAFHVPPPYDGSGTTFVEDIDTGPLFGVGNICVADTGEAVVPYVRANGGNFDVFFAAFDGSSWSTSPIPGTSSDNYHTSECFRTSDGLFVMALNVTDQRWDFFRSSDPAGPPDFLFNDSLGESELGDPPQDPFLPEGGIAVAESSSMFVTGEFSAAFPMDDGDLDGYLLIGSGDTANIDGSYLPRNYNNDSEFEQGADLPLRRREGSGDDVLWVVNQKNGQLRLTRHGLTNPGLDQTITLGTIGSGSLLGFQGLGVAEGPDGHVYVLADKAYRVSPDLTSTTVMAGYPFEGLGGPVNIVFPPGMPTGFAVGPGSQVLGILDLSSVFADGFETGGTGAWSNTTR